MKSKIKLNLGCGMVRPEGWVNADSSVNSFLQKSFIGSLLTKKLKLVEYKDHNVIYVNLNKRWKYSDNSVDVVYSSHVLEHLSISKSEQFLNEAYRVLKPGGTIRIVVPDLFQLSNEYLQKYSEGDASASDSFLYFMNMHVEGQYRSTSVLHRILGILQNYPHQHKYMYDRISLKGKLVNNGFSNIKEATYGESFYLKEIKEVEYSREGVPSIYLEAKKL